MASKASIAYRQSVAILKIKEDVAAISEALGIESKDILQPVKGPADYQEAIRTEQLSALLGQVRAKVAPVEETQTENPASPEGTSTESDGSEGEGDFPPNADFAKADVSNLTVAELKDRAKEAHVKGYGSMNKAQLIEALSNG